MNQLSLFKIEARWRIEANLGARKRYCRGVRVVMGWCGNTLCWTNISYRL